MKLLVGLPGAEKPPQRPANSLNPTSNSARLDRTDVHVACRTAGWSWCVYIAVSGACVALPPSIHPDGLSRHVPLVPGHPAPPQPRDSSQNRFNLFRVVSCQVRRRPLVSVEPSLRAWRAVLGTYVHAFGLPAFALANIPGADVPLPYVRPR